MSQRIEPRAVFRVGIALILAAAFGPASAVVLDDESPMDIVLDDGTQVRLYREVKPSAGGKIPSKPLPDLDKLRRATVGLTDREEAIKAQEEAAKEKEGGKVPFVLPKAKLKPVLDRLRRSQKATNNYYYLPTNLHLSKRPDGVPEFLFLKFTTEARESEGGASGGLMHFLMEWGLTKEQENELAAKIRQKDPKGKLMGAVPMEPAGETGTFKIISATLSDDSLTRTLVTSGKAPLLPGGKAAVASRLTATGAQLLAATFEKARSITDVSIALDFTYHTLSPAAKGTITFDWERLSTEREKIEAEFTRTEREETDAECFFIFCSVWTEEHYSLTYNELREQYKFLEEKKIVDLDWQEFREDERIEKVREAFFQYFLRAMAEPAPPPPPPEEGEQGAMPTIPEDESIEYFYFKREAVSSAMERKRDVFTLDARFAVRRPHQLVGNLASWYNGVRDNPKCVASVNLNDPFFQHRDINFILDLDAKEMFDEAVNYVTVNVRKRRDSGHDFEDHVTIDAKYVQENGINATLTYARGEDKNPDVYEYQTQWSLKGGNVFPKSPPWERGRWEGVTLAPPVVPRTIEVEGDLEDMISNDITRVTAQVHYLKFGKEVETNVHLSPAQGETLVAKKIFMDRDAKGYAYRLIVNHKTEGKLVLDWAPRIGDDYIYATLPPGLLEEGSDLKTHAKEAAKTLVNSAKEKVLDKFEELLGS
jgi:hypothetical protein